MIRESRVLSKVRAQGLWHQVTYILVAEEEGQSFHEIYENGVEYGHSLEKKYLKAVLEELKASGLVCSVPVFESERWHCMEVV